MVCESTVNWSWLNEILKPLWNVRAVTLANPFKVRLIAEAQIKTDKSSARALATLLRLNVLYPERGPIKSKKMRLCATGGGGIMSW